MTRQPVFLLTRQPHKGQHPCALFYQDITHQFAFDAPFTMAKWQEASAAAAIEEVLRLDGRMRQHTEGEVLFYANAKQFDKAIKARLAEVASWQS